MQVKRNTAEAGFTALELSIVLVVAGLLWGAGLLLYGNMSEYFNHENQRYSVTNSTEIVNTFYAQQSRYPCPADPELSPADADYGLEDCSLPTVIGARDADGDGNNDPVYVGILPTRAYFNSDGSTTGDIIGLKSLYTTRDPFELSTKDPWSNDLVYAVTVSLTTSASFNADRGAIHIRDEFGENTGGIDNDAHFALISKGKFDLCPSGSSSFSYEPPEEATELVTGAPLPAEMENCDGDAIFADAIKNNSATDAYYDDYVGFKLSNNSTLWDTVGATSHIRNDNIGKVVIGNYEDTFGHDILGSVKLDVSGDVFANINVQGDFLCDEDGKCFKPEDLFGISCPDAGMFIKSTEIVDNRLTVTCEALSFSTHATCGGGRYLKGIFSDGTIDCVN